MRRAVRLTALVLLTAFGAVPAGWAQDVQWQVEVGFGGKHAPNAWTPLRVTLHNSGESRSGRVIVPVSPDDYSGPVPYSVAVDLPQGARKSYQLLIPRVSHGMKVKLFAGDIADVKDIEASSSTASEDLLTVVLGGPEGILGFLNGTPAPISDTVPSGPSGWRGAGTTSGSSDFAIGRGAWGALPESWLGWDGVDVVVLAGSEMGDAEEAELQALRLWVRLGGTLVVTGGARAPALADGRLGDLLPMEVTGTRTVPNLDALSAWVGEPIERQAALIADGALREGADELTDGGATPLVLRRPFGAGTVVMTTFDFTAEPVKYWDGQHDLWGRLVSAGAAPEASDSGILGIASGAQYQPWQQTGTVANAAGHSDEAALPPLWLVVGFLLAYIVVLVPLNYWFVNRLQRRELAWLTTPAIILLFFGAAWGTGFALRGHQTLLNRVAVVDARPGQQVARALGFAGIFSPAKMEYGLRLNGTAAAAGSAEDGFNRFGVEFAPERKVRDLAVNMWSTRVVQVPFVADLGGSITGRLMWNGSDLSAIIKNETKMDFRIVGIVREGRIGEKSLASSGQEVMVDMIRATELGAEAAEDATLGERALAQLFGRDQSGHAGAFLSPVSPQRPWLVAVVDEPLLPVELIDRAARVEDASVIVTRLPVELAGVGSIYVPEWLVDSQIVGSEGSVRQYEDYQGRHLSITSGSSVTWQFTMPTGAEGATARSLEANIIADPSAGSYPVPPGTSSSSAPAVPGMTVEALNRETGEWEQATVTGSRAPVPSPAKAMNEDGTVLVRLKATGGEVQLRAVQMSGSVNPK